jgi:HNH endonuclease
MPLSGTTLGVARSSVEERFWAKVNRQGPIPEYRPDLGPCWIWTGNAPPRLGYGLFWMDGTKIGAHVASYRLLVGPVPPGKELDHLCRVTLCVKSIADASGPEHLEPVTHLENMQRGMLPKMRAHLENRCLQGHPLTGDNLYVNPSGAQNCRICRRAYLRAWRARRRT